VPLVSVFYGYFSYDVALARSLWTADRRTQYLLLESGCTPLAIDGHASKKLSPDPGFEQQAIDVARSDGLAIVATLLLMDEQTYEEKWAYLQRLSPPHNWINIGHDVVDEGLISGLTNCSYRDSEKIRLLGEYKQHINGFHLFANEVGADAFRREANARLPEHAPFYVSTVFLVAGDLSAWA
jgi:hypothetical protein